MPEYLTENEKSLVFAAINVYESELRKACKEDQGIESGEEGTVGYELQKKYEALKKKLRWKAIELH